MRRDQIPVDVLGGERVEVIVTPFGAWTAEVETLPVTDVGYQLHAEQIGDREDRL